MAVDTEPVPARNLMMTAADDEAAGTDPNVPSHDPAESPDAPAAPDTADLHTYIGARLRKAFDDVAKQPVPERFLQLMRDLDRT